MSFEFNKPAIEIAIDAINKSTGHRFTRRDITLNNIEYRETGYYNSKATICPLPGSVYYDEVEVYYDRFNLIRLFHHQDVNIPLGNQKRLADFLPIINKRYHLSLTKEDIIDGVIPEGIKLPFRVLIQIHDDNPAFIGYIPVSFTNDETSLSYILAKTDNTFTIDNPYIEDDVVIEDSHIIGETYLLDYDYSRFAKELQLFYTDMEANGFIETILESHPEEWHNVPYQMPFNIYKSKVVYNGDIKQQQYTPVNTDFTDVLVLEINETYCENIRGHLIFRYRKY